MNAATRIISPTGIITSEDRSQVLEHAAEILAGVRYDLANGDWLIPGVSCQVVSMTGSKP